MTNDPIHGVLWGMPIWLVGVLFILAVFLFLVAFVSFNMVRRWFVSKFKSEQFNIGKIDDDEWHRPDESPEGEISENARIFFKDDSMVAMDNAFLRLKKKRDEGEGEDGSGDK